MKNILYIVSTLQSAGPTNQLSYIIKNLDRIKFYPQILTLSPEPQNSEFDYFKNQLDIEITSLNLTRFQGLFKMKRKVKDFLNQKSIDLIHTQGLRADVVSSKQKIDIPRIATIRNYPQDDYAMTYGRMIGYAFSKAHVQAMKKLTHVYGVSDAVANNLKLNFALRNVGTVRNGVDLKKFIPISEKNAPRQTLSIPTKKTIWITSIGKDLRKDSATVAHAFKNLYSGDNNHFLIFVGDGALKKECQTILADNKDVKFTGKIPDISEYLRCSNYFISSSKAEGLPNAVLESLASGVPVLLSDIEPHEEIISLNKKAGLTYKTGSATDLTKAMKEISSSDQRTIPDEALSLVQTHLDSKDMSLNYQNIYNELLG